MTKTRARTAAGTPIAADADAILRVAARLFRQRGYERTTVREVARAAGILLGSLQYRFPAKEDLLLALMRRAVASTSAAVREAVDGVHDPLERVRLGLRAHMRLLLGGDDAVPVLLTEWRALEGPALREMLRLRDGYESLWERLLGDVVRSGVVRPGVDVHLVRLLGFGALNGSIGWYRPGGALAPEAIADAFFDWVCNGALLPATPEENR